MPLIFTSIIGIMYTVLLNLYAELLPGIYETEISTFHSLFTTLAKGASKL